MRLRLRRSSGQGPDAGAGRLDPRATRAEFLKGLAGGGLAAVAAGGAYWLYLGADGSLHLGPGAGGDLLTITRDGRLGVGTRTPLATLDVAGDIRCTDGLRVKDAPAIDATGTAVQSYYAP
jgi:hypothetical protein